MQGHSERMRPPGSSLNLTGIAQSADWAILPLMVKVSSS
jgi:hypothetical protein